MAVAKLGSWVLGSDTLGTRVISPFVQQPAAFVGTGGVIRNATSVEVVREIAATTPASLGTAGGLMAGTLKATLTEPEDVHVRKRSPWDRVDAWPPSGGDQLTLDAHLGELPGRRRFLGQVDTVSGSAGSTEVSVDGVDTIDRLNRRIVFEALADVMPAHPLQQSGGVDTHYIYRVTPLLRHEHYVERVLRECGWHLGPRPPANKPDTLHVPMFGSIIDTRHRGEQYLVQEARAVEGDWLNAEWGLGLSVRGRTKWVLPTPLAGNQFEVQFLVQHDQRKTYDSQSVEFTLSDSGWASPSNYRLRIRVHTEWSDITVNTHEGYSSGQPVVATASHQPPASKMSLKVRVVIDGSRHKIYFDDVEVASARNGVQSTSQGRFLFLNQWNTILNAPDATPTPIIGSIITGKPGEVENPEPPNARMLLGTIHRAEMVAGPYIDDSGLNILKDIAQATGASAWIDGHDQFTWAHADALGKAPSAATLTADADILDMAWNQDSRDFRHEVLITGKQPQVTSTRRAITTLFQGRGDMIDTDDDDDGKTWTITEGVSPSGNEDWFPQRGPTYQLGPGLENRDLFTGVRGDWFGGALYYGDWSKLLYFQDGGSVSHELTVINSQSLIAKTTLAVNNTDEGKRIEYVAPRIPNTHFSEEDYANMAPHNGTPLPIIRGFGKITWETEPRVHGAYKGPVTAADYHHDVKWWVQGEEIKRLADWMSKQVSAPRPLIEDLPVVPRHDLDLGNVITIEEHAVYGVTIKALIIGIREQYSHGEAAMTLTLRVLEATGGN